jgi:hypothetical protein
MAIVGSHLTADNGGGDDTTTDTAPISPSANSAVCVGIVSFGTTTMSLAGNGITYTQKVNLDLGGDYRLWMFAGAAASPSAGVITMTHDNEAFVSWIVDNFTGIEVSGPTNANTATNTGTGTALSCTLGAFAHANNGVWTFGRSEGSRNFSAGTDFALLHNGNGTSIFSLSHGSQWRDANDTSVDMSINASAVWGIGALELVAEVVAGSPALTFQFAPGPNVLLRM